MSENAKNLMILNGTRNAFFPRVMIEKKYHTVIHQNETHDPTLEDIIAQGGTPSEMALQVAEHLSMWDYGEYHDTPQVIFKPNWADKYHFDSLRGWLGDYVLVLNTAEGCATLYIHVPEEEEE